MNPTIENRVAEHENRLTRLEAINEQIGLTLQDIRQDMRDQRSELRIKLEEIV